MQGQPDNFIQHDTPQEELEARGLTDACRDSFVADAAHGDDGWAELLFDSWLRDELLGRIDHDVTGWVNGWLSRHP